MTDIKIEIPKGSPANSGNDNTPAEGVNPSADQTQAELEAKEKAALEAELDAPYFEKKIVVISSVRNYSSYRRINMQALGKPKATIGSSVKSVRILMSNKGELAAYYPEIIGVAANHPDFVTRVKSYLNNIFFDVNDGDNELNISFHYNHKRDYLAIKAEEDKILSTFEKVDRSNEAELYKAAVKRDEAITRLEQTKYQYGMPDNVEEYIIWRHCLNYPDVAKDEAFINSNSNLRFFIKDVAKEDRPVYFSLMNRYEVNGTAYSVGGSFGMKEKLKMIAKLLIMCDESKDIIDIEDYEIPDVKVKAAAGTKKKINYFD